MSRAHPIYLDNQATTPLDPRVLEAMMPWLGPQFGNPHSATHAYGWEAAEAIETARGHIADVIGADPKALFFTSGATEANNLAIKGVMEAMRDLRPRVILPPTEHKCVLESARAAARQGAELVELAVDGDGLVDLAALDRLLDDRTALVSVMAVNNEIGVIQPLAEIGALCRARGAYFHCDAAQAFGKVALDVEAMNIDLMSLSGHKIYGPKGVGAIFVRRFRPRVRIVPQMSGGGQESGMRSGTLSPALSVGFGEAARLAGLEMTKEEQRMARLFERFLGMIEAAVPDVVLNGHRQRRWHGNVNLSFPGTDAELLLSGLPDLALSSGAACASATSGPSYVLAAIGRSPSLARAALRIGFGRFTADEEVETAARRIIEAVTEAREARSWSA